MIYRDFKGLKLSGLGMGNMRLPVIDGDDSRIDFDRASALIRRAYEGGVNYFDTAYGYHGGNSENTVGRALAGVPRGSFYLADKFPGFSVENVSRVKEIFEEQLSRCGTDYFDFYLFHNIYEKNIDMCLDPQYGVFDYLLEQKRAGRIRHLGFSCHGELPTLRRFLDAGGDELEFCQIQLNYVDWSLQHADEKVALLNERGIPVWVMEGVRGGRLVNLPAEAVETLKALRPEESVVSWAFRFLQSVPGVTMVLSGMSTPEQVDENLATWAEDKPLSEAEFKTVTDIGRDLFAGAPCPARPATTASASARRGWTSRACCSSITRPPTAGWTPSSSGRASPASARTSGPPPAWPATAVRPCVRRRSRSPRPSPSSRRC